MEQNQLILTDVLVNFHTLDFSVLIYGIKLLYSSQIEEQIGPICGAFRSAIPDMSNTENYLGILLEMENYAT